MTGDMVSAPNVDDVEFAVTFENRDQYRGPLCIVGELCARNRYFLGEDLAHPFYMMAVAAQVPGGGGQTHRSKSSRDGYPMQAVSLDNRRCCA
jgi:hypothetical protein